MYFLLLCLVLVAAVLGQQAVSADVNVSKAGPQTMIVGFAKPYPFQVNVANVGPGDSSLVVLTDEVPAQFVIQSVQPSYANGTFLCELPVNNLLCAAQFNNVLSTLWRASL